MKDMKYAAWKTWKSLYLLNPTEHYKSWLTVKKTPEKIMKKLKRFFVLKNKQKKSLMNNLNQLDLKENITNNLRETFCCLCKKLISLLMLNKKKNLLKCKRNLLLGFRVEQQQIWIQVLKDLTTEILIINI